MLFSVLKLESFWATIHGFILGVFGFAAFPAFALSGYTSLRVAIDKFDSSTNVRVVFEGIFIYLFLLFLTSFHMTRAFPTAIFTACYGKGVSGGGLLGGILSYPAACVFSKAGAAIIIILLLVIIFLFVAGISFKQIAEAFFGLGR